MLRGGRCRPRTSSSGSWIGAADHGCRPVRPELGVADGRGPRPPGADRAGRGPGDAGREPGDGRGGDHHGLHPGGRPGGAGVVRGRERSGGAVAVRRLPGGVGPGARGLRGRRAGAGRRRGRPAPHRLAPTGRPVALAHPGRGGRLGCAALRRGLRQPAVVPAGPAVHLAAAAAPRRDRSRALARTDLLAGRVGQVELPPGPVGGGRPELPGPVGQGQPGFPRRLRLEWLLRRHPVDGREGQEHHP